MPKDMTVSLLTAAAIEVTGGGVLLKVDETSGVGVYAGTFDPVGAFEPNCGSIYLRRINQPVGPAAFLNHNSPAVPGAVTHCP